MERNRAMFLWHTLTTWVALYKQVLKKYVSSSFLLIHYFVSVYQYFFINEF